jgi:hypothetical protein
MKYHHQDLASGRWQELSLIEQLANVGSDVERAIEWREKNEKRSQMAFFRALELLDFTIADPKNKKLSKLKELCRLREALVDYFFGENLYHSSDELWEKYFYPFSWAARLGR